MKNILIGTTAIIILAFTLVKGIEKQEQVRCNQLAEQSEQFADHYYTNYEKEMCGL